VTHRFSEAFSGLSLERPKLDELRELVRGEAVDILVCYCLDRLSRDPVHGVIIIEELDKHHVTLEAVTETVDSSEVGKLISYIRGFASKLEAQKILERTMRGKKARAREGRIPGGGASRLYGCDYIKVSQPNGGRRVINDTEAQWVVKMYDWLVNDGMSVRAITLRLRELGAPTKFGQPWCWSTVLKILKNPAYTGRTYAFTAMNGKPGAKPREDWIEIHDVTPAIISDELFEAAQKQLRENTLKASRNTRHEYLLRGHIWCQSCQHSFYGCTTGDLHGSKIRLRRRYRCRGKSALIAPGVRCDNASWQADKLETLVWTHIARVLDNPELIISEIEKQRQEANQLGVLESELQQAQRQLKALEREQEQLLQWALKGFPEVTIVSENKRINQRRATLQAQKAELDTRIKASREAAVSLPKIDQFARIIKEQLISLDFETKRQVLDMLDIKVWLDGHNVEITGFLPVEVGAIVTTQSA